MFERRQPLDGLASTHGIVINCLLIHMLICKLGLAEFETKRVAHTLLLQVCRFTVIHLLENIAENY